MHRFLIPIAAPLFAATPAFAQVRLPASVAVDEGKIAAVTATRPAGTSKGKTLSFTYRTVAETALASEDFVARSGSQSIRKNANSYAINIQTIDDATFEQGERLFLEVVAAGVTTRVPIVIRDNDPAPPPPPAPAALAIDPASCLEGDVCRVTVRRSGGDLSAIASFNYFTANTENAKAGVDFSARSGGLKFAAGQTQSSFTFPSIENTITNGPRHVDVKITSPDAPIAIGLEAIELVDDDAAVPDPAPDPSPEVDPLPEQPPVTPSPPTDTGLNGNVFVPSPTPDGLVPLNMSEGDLTPAGIPGTAAPDVVGAFRFVCRVGSVNRNDSLLYWGKPGAAHWHANYGLSKADPDETYATMQTRTDAYGLCQMPTADPGNRSRYWTSFPMMKVPAGTPVAPWMIKFKPDLKVVDGKLAEETEMFWLAGHFLLYYKERPTTDPACKETSPWGPKYLGCFNLPNGINMIFGFNMKDLKPGQVQADFRCIGSSLGEAKYKMMAPALAECVKAWDAGVRNGLRMSIVLPAPHCVDPRYLDTPNHMDHLSYSVQKLGTGRGGCTIPATGATELKIIPGLTFLSSYDWNEWVQAAAKADPEWGVYLSSDPHYRAANPLAKAGETFHGDFRESWLIKVRTKFWENCINKLLNCSAGVLGNGEQLRGGGAPWYPSLGKTSWAHPTPVVPVRDQGYDAEW